MANLNLLGTTSLVETPFIKVEIGKYSFGVGGKNNAQSDMLNNVIANFVSTLDKYIYIKDYIYGWSK